MILQCGGNGTYSCTPAPNSTNGIHPSVAAIIVLAFLIVVLYIILRVRKSMKEDERLGRR